MAALRPEAHSRDFAATKEKTKTAPAEAGPLQKRSAQALAR